MDELIAYLAIIAAVVALVGMVIAALISIGPFIAACICGIGFLSGCGVAVKNFREVLIEAHERLP